MCERYIGKLRWSKAQLVEVATTYALSLGLKSFPSLPKNTLGKMGLLVSESNDDEMENDILLFIVSFHILNRAIVDNDHFQIALVTHLF